GEPGAGSVRPPRPRRAAAEPGPRARPLPGSGRAPAPSGARALGRPAADGGGRPRADGEPAPADAGRAVARHRAPAGARDPGRAGGDQPRRGGHTAGGAERARRADPGPPRLHPGGRPRGGRGRGPGAPARSARAPGLPRAARRGRSAGRSGNRAMTPELTVLAQLGVDPFASLLLVIPGALLAGAVLYLGLFGFVVRAHEHTRVKNSLLVGFGLALSLHALAVRLWTADDRSITTTYGGAVLSVGPIAIPLIRLASLAVALALIGALHLLLARWRWGKAIRATAEDW